MRCQRTLAHRLYGRAIEVHKQRPDAGDIAALAPLQVGLIDRDKNPSAFFIEPRHLPSMLLQGAVQHPRHRGALRGAVGV